MSRKQLPLGKSWEFFLRLIKTLWAEPRWVMVLTLMEWMLILDFSVWSSLWGLLESKHYIATGELPESYSLWLSQKKIFCSTDCLMNNWEGSIRFPFVLETEANSRKGYFQTLSDQGCCVRGYRSWLKQGHPAQDKVGMYFQSVLCLSAMPLTQHLNYPERGRNIFVLFT